MGIGEGPRTDEEARSDSVIADEDARLDEAMLQADERLLASLQRDELRRRRRRWALGGIAMTITIAAIVTTLLTIGPGVTSTETKKDAVDRAAWEQKIKNLRTHNETAFSVGPQLMDLDPDVGFEIFQNVWPELTNEDVKTGLLKSFAFARHPRVLDVLHIGITDQSIEVRNYAFSYLENYAFQSFAEDPAAYYKWHKEFGGKPVEEVLRENCQRFAKKLAEAEGEEKQCLARQLQDFDLGSGKLKTSYESKRKYAIEAGILDVLERWLTEAKPNRDVLEGACRALCSLRPDQAYLRRVVLPLVQKGSSVEIRAAAINVLGMPEHKWAVDPLLEMLTKETDRSVTWALASNLAEIGDPRVIPTMISVIEADNTYDTIYGVGYFGLGRLTGVKYDQSHDGVWWRKWWETNKSQYPKDMQQLKIPDKRTLEASGQKQVNQSGGKADLADITDIPAQDLNAGDNEKMRYFLVGPRKDSKPPQNGYGLVLVLPGGDGGPDFLPFVKRIFKHALPDGYLIAQPVAVNWTPEQKIVWPTSKSKVKNQSFSTEQFVEAIAKDVKKKYTLNNGRIFTLSWSSGGPAAYAVSLSEETPVTGSFIAMSVFKPESLPPLKNARGHAYFLYHSPDDRICPLRMAEEARDELKDAGAVVEFKEYMGGHGWHGDVFGDIRLGIQWLEDHQGFVPQGAEKPGHSQASSQPANTAMNLIDNGGFEKGRRGWIIGNNSRRLKIDLDREEKYEGRQSLKISKRGGMPIDIIRHNVGDCPKGKTVNVSALVKAQEVTNAWLKFYIWDDSGQVLVKDVDITRVAGTFDWKKVEKTFTFPAQTASAAVQFWMVMDGQVWLDDVRVTPVDPQSSK